MKLCQECQVHEITIPFPCGKCRPLCEHCIFREQTEKIAELEAQLEKLSDEASKALLSLAINIASQLDHGFTVIIPPSDASKVLARVAVIGAHRVVTNKVS